MDWEGETWHLSGHGCGRVGIQVAANDGDLEVTMDFQPWKQHWEGRTGSWSWERTSPGLDFPKSSPFVLYKMLGNLVRTAKVQAQGEPCEH